MASRLYGPRVKIERAKKHVGDFESEIRRFLDSSFYTLKTKAKPAIGQVAYYVASVDPIPNPIPSILGDAVHNRRSALDHLMCELVKFGGGVIGKDTYFPICETGQQYKSAFGKGEIKKMPVGVQGLLRGCQPYKTGDFLLCRLHELDIADKHKLILTVVSALNSWGLKNPPIILGNLPGRFRMEVGTELLNIPADTYAKAHDNIDFGFDVTFGNSGILDGDSVLQTLEKMTEVVSRIVDSFESFLISK